MLSTFDRGLVVVKMLGVTKVVQVTYTSTKVVIHQCCNTKQGKKITDRGAAC